MSKEVALGLEHVTVYKVQIIPTLVLILGVFFLLPFVVKSKKRTASDMIKICHTLNSLKRQRFHIIF